MKKILITSNLYLPNIGGIENSLYYLAKSGVENGDNISLVVSDIVDKDNLSIEDRTKLNCNIFQYTVPKTKCKLYNLIKHYFNAYKMYKEIKNKGCDLVISRFHFNTLLAYLAGHKNISYVVPGVIKYQNSSNDMNDNLNLISSKMKYILHTLIQYFAFKVSNKIYVFSGNMEKQILSIYNGDNIIKTSPGIDYLKFTFSENNDYSVLINLLIVSRLVSVKNIAIAIEALSHLDDTYRLEIVGDGSERFSLEKIVKKLKLDDRVTFLGSQSNVVPFYSKAHIFLLPSTYEPFGQTILEASSCGIPTVSFSNKIVDTATNNILENFGIYSEKLDSLSYAKSIDQAFNEYYINQSKDRKLLREYIIKKYSWENLYKDLRRDIDE